MTPEYIRFLRELRDNNNRPWFKLHKEEFDDLRAQWIADIDTLIAKCSQWEPAFGMLSGKECVYRIYRDTRFSLDKTPYKTHFSAGLSPKGRTNAVAGYYISAGFEEGFTGIYGGIWNPDAAMLRKLRHAIADNDDEFNEIINNPEFVSAFPAWCGRSLKTIPKGWPKDHPMAHALRLIDIGREHLVAPEFFTQPDWTDQASHLMQIFKPLNDFINYSLFEE
ncbi:MAG: DUF2461 domain-containing protein [Muribaculaceae bacterium]